MTDFGEPYVDVDEWRDSPVRHRYVHGGLRRHRDPVLVLPAAGGAVRGAVLPAHHAGARQRAPRPVGGGRAGQDRLLDRQRRLLRRDERRRSLGQPGLVGRPHHRRLPGERRGRAALPGGRGRDVRRAPTVRVRVRRQRRRLPHDRRGREHDRRVGRRSSRTSSARRWRSRTCSPSACTRSGSCAHRFDQIVDAVEPGGSGDPYEGLDAEERDALPEVTRMGFPPRSWFGYRTMGMHAFPVLYQGVSMADPAYFEDFWTEPGYLGQAAAALPAAGQRAAPVRGGGDDQRTRRPRSSASTWAANPVRPAAASTPPGAGPTDGRPSPSRCVSRPRTGVDVEGGGPDVVSGAAAGRQLGALRVVGDIVVLGPGDRRGQGAAAGGRRGRGRQPRLPRRADLPPPPGPGAGATPPGTSSATPDGTPIYPQRPLLLGPLFAAAAAGTVQTGAFEGKMIVVESLLDREALPWQADWYRSQVQEHLGRRDRRPLPALVHRQRPARRRRGPGGPDPHRQLPRRAAPGAPRRERAGSRRASPRRRAPRYEVVDGQVVVPAEATRAPRHPAGGDAVGRRRATGPTWPPATR